MEHIYHRCLINLTVKSIKSWINIKKGHKVIQLNQKAWLKSYIDMNTKLRTEAKNDFEDDLFKLMNNSESTEISEERII